MKAFFLDKDGEKPADFQTDGFFYETHLHTAPVSRCATATVEETLCFYKKCGYAGVFITNHFLDGNINIDRSLPYEERIDFYFSDYEAALSLGEKIGIDVFLGVEMTYGGTDFLVYGLDKAWFLAHSEIEGMKRTAILSMLTEAGALVIQAHPFREAAYIDHIRLFPRHVHGVEICNTSRSDFENRLAAQYAENYGLIPLAGSDNHRADKQTVFGGMASRTPLVNEKDFIDRMKGQKMTPFRMTSEE